MTFAKAIATYDQQAQTARWRGPLGWLTYRCLGEGPPLLVIPGIASTYRGYCQLLNALACSFQTFIIDYPGENPDDQAPVHSIKHDQLLDQIFGLLDHLQFQDVALYGPSFGSTLVLKSLLRQPDRFTRSVTQGGFLKRRMGTLERLALAVGKRIPGTVARLPLRKALIGLKNRRHFRQLDDRDAWTIYVEQNGLTPIGPLAQRLEMLPTLNLSVALQGLAVPVLALQGAEDQVIVRSDWKQLCEASPSIQGMLLPGVGHQPHYTHPSMLADLITKWVRSLPLPTL